MADRIPEKVIQAVLERSGGVCEICGSNDRCQIHHIVYRSQATNHDIENLILLCYRHHFGTYGVHGKHGKALNLELKRKTQQMYFDKGLSEEEVRRKMGEKLY